MTSSFPPSRRTLAITAILALGLFLAGFSYGYATPSFDPPFGGSHAHGAGQDPSDC